VDGNALAKDNTEKPEKGSKSRNLASLASGGQAGARLNLTNQTQFPFIICQINLKRALIPDVREKEKKALVF